MENLEAKIQISILYGCRCMLTGLKTKNLTYHHILKKEYGGKATVKNGADIITEIHQWLHNNIELNDRELFELINECLDLYKQCVDYGELELILQWEDECMPLFREKVERKEQMLTLNKKTRY